MGEKFLVLGRAGYGKTHLVLERYINFLKQNREDEVIVLFPTYSQVEHRRDYLLRKEDISGFFDQSLVTFPGLAGIILEDSSAQDLMSFVEKELILTEVLKKNHFDYFALIKDFPGFKRALLQFIREVKENFLDPKHLESLAAGLYHREKIDTLVSVYENYCQALKQKGRWDQEDLLLKTLDKLEGKDAFFSQIKLLLVDGFHDYTPLQFRILEKLISRIPKVYISLTYDPSLKSSIFPTCQKTYQRLAGLGFETINLTRNRRSSSSGICRIEAGLWGEDSEKENMDDSIFIIEAVDGEDEIEGIARKIVELVIEEGRHFKDIGVIFRNVESYGRILESIFPRHRIPFRIYAKSPLKGSPLIKAILNFSRIFIDSWKDKWILKTLKSQYFFSDMVVDELEYHILVQGGINSREGWQKLVNDLPGEPIKRFFARIKEEEQTISGRHSPQFFRDWYKKTSGEFINLAEDYQLARDEAASLSAFYQIIDDLTKYLLTRDDDYLTFFQYFTTLVPIIESASRGRLDRRDEVVNIIDVKEARGWEIPIVFVGGLLEREFPRQINEDIFLRDEERNFLNGQGLFFQETRDYRNEERYLFYVALTRAKKRIYLTYSAADQRGNETLPSFFLEEVKKLFLEESIIEHTLLRIPFQAINIKEEINSPLDLKNYLYYQLTRPYPPEEKNELLVIWLYNNLLKDPGFKEEFEEVLRGLNPPALSRLTRERIGSRERIFSHTELNQYAICPYRHFAGYVLRLEGIPVQMDKILNFQKQGLIIHVTLERFYQENKSGDISHIFEEVFTQETRGMEMGIEEKRIKREMKRTARLFVDKEKEYCKLYRCLPDRFEVKFGYGGEKPLEIIDEKLGKIGISGKIDRIDIGNVNGEQVGIVIDYKYNKGSFNQKRWKEIEDGIDFQLAIYLLALKEIFKIKPIGGEYYSLKDLKRGGIGVENFVEKKLLPPSSGRDRVILSSHEFDDFLKQEKQFIIQYAKEILSGEIAPHPRSLERCGAEMCDYFDLCRFDKSKFRGTNQ